MTPLAPHLFDLVSIVAAALREHPQNEHFITWLRGPKPAPQEAILMLYELSGLYWCGIKLATLMIRAQQELGRMPWEASCTWDFYTVAYQTWYAAQDPKDLAAVNNDETMRTYLNPILPEQQFHELGERYTTVESVVALCDRKRIKHQCTDAQGEIYTVFDYLRLKPEETYTGAELWARIHYNSSHGWLVRYEDLVAAAGFSPQPVSAT